MSKMRPKLNFSLFIIIPIFLCNLLHLVVPAVTNYHNVDDPRGAGCRGGYDESPLAGIGIDSPLTYNYYKHSCDVDMLEVVADTLYDHASKVDARIAASLLRLHYLDCFTNGCDASILLDDTKDFKGEKNAFLNLNSTGAYEVIDNIKATFETVCPSTVSCADILTLAASESVVMGGGPRYHVRLGRRDGLTACNVAAIEQLPSPSESLQSIITKFAYKGLDLWDVAALSGAHTVGLASCSTFKGRLYNFKGSRKPDPALSSLALSHFRGMCPNKDSSNTNLASLDWGSTYKFDNSYYGKLLNNSGLLESDQALIGDPRTVGIVHEYNKDSEVFFSDFASSMVKLGKLGVLTGSKGQIRKNCRFVN